MKYIYFENRFGSPLVDIGIFEYNTEEELEAFFEQESNDSNWSFELNDHNTWGFELNDHNKSQLESLMNRLKQIDGGQNAKH